MSRRAPSRSRVWLQTQRSECAWVKVVAGAYANCSTGRGFCPQYQALWVEQRDRLALCRARVAPAPRGEPGMPNPLQMFAHYPSASLTLQSRIHRDRAAGPGARGLRELSMWQFADGWLPDAAAIAHAWEVLPDDAANAPTIEHWAARLEIDRVQAERLAAWMAKVGLVAIR